MYSCECLTSIIECIKCIHLTLNCEILCPSTFLINLYCNALAANVSYRYKIKKKTFHQSNPESLLSELIFINSLLEKWNTNAPNNIVHAQLQYIKIRWLGRFNVKTPFNTISRRSPDIYRRAARPGVGSGNAKRRRVAKEPIKYSFHVVVSFLKLIM